MMRFKSLSQRPRHFNNFTGLKVEEFKKLQESIKTDWQQARLARLKTHRIRKIGGGRKPKLDNLEDRLLVFLIYAKLYPSYLLLEYLFSLDESTICRIVQEFLPLLSEKIIINRQGKKITTLEELREVIPDLDEVLIDTTEQRVPRPVKKRARKKDLFDWRKLVKTIKSVKDEVQIGIVGKYFITGDFVLSDVYISVIEAIKHAAWHHNKKPVLSWLNSEEYEKDVAKLKELKQFDGIIVPGGFGSRGVEGKIKAIQHCRENKIPYLGLCYGMQMAVVEFARNVCGLIEAHTTEIDSKTPHPVIHIMEEQEGLVKERKCGGTMRLGAHPCVLSKKSISYRAYGRRNISERHRHRYEFNNAYREQFEKAGMILAGTSPDNRLVEIIEIKGHPFFVGTQFHPEFKSRPLKPHPLFRQFIAACLKARG